MSEIEPIASSAPRPDSPPRTARDTLRAVDDGWHAFLAAAERFPAERMNEHLTEDGWMRKQMLAHISVWHDLTTERLAKLMSTGRPAELDQPVDSVNARAARQAVGRTAGEIIKDMEGTFNRLRRHLQRLSDAQLVAHDAWAAHVIAANTYEHYADHMPDLYLPEPVDGKPGRR